MAIDKIPLWVKIGAVCGIIYAVMTLLFWGSIVILYLIGDAV